MRFVSTRWHGAITGFVFTNTVRLMLVHCTVFGFFLHQMRFILFTFKFSFKSQTIAFNIHWILFLFYRVNYLEIYNEKVYDLLNNREELKIKESANGEISLSCTGSIAKSDDDILRFVDNGNNHRKVAETKMNVQSSRSHAILQIVS